MADGSAEVLMKSTQGWLIISSPMSGRIEDSFAGGGGGVKRLRCVAPTVQREGFSS